MGELGALFNPGMRHEQEEQRAKQMLREEEGTGRKGRLNIDLSSGTVVIGSDAAAQRHAASSANGSANGVAAHSGDDAAHGIGNGVADDAAPAASATGTDEPGDRKSDADDSPAPAAVKAARRPSAVPSGKARRKAAKVYRAR